MIRDYRIYELNRKEMLQGIFEGMLLNGVIAFLFYDTWIALIPGCILIYFYVREKRKILCKKRMRQLKIDFRDFLNTMIATLQTGRSIENAFLESHKDLVAYNAKESVFHMETRRICAGITVGEPLEKLLLDFSARSGMEELEYFSQVFSIGRRSGGNLIGIMKNTIRMLNEGMEAEEEVYTVITEKRMEFYIMCVIPLAMMIYLRIGAGNFVESLYGNVTGVLVMTVCLVIYGGCYLYGKKLLEAEE